MSKHSIEKKVPESWRTPENIPPVPKFRTIVADPPWQKNQSAPGRKTRAQAATTAARSSIMT